MCPASSCLEQAKTMPKSAARLRVRVLVAALLPFAASLGVGALSKAGQRHLLTGGIGTDRAFKRDRHQYASLGNDGGRVKNERPSNERAFTIRDFAGS